MTIQCNHLEATAVVQSERQQLAMLQSVRSYLNDYLALAAGQDQFPASAYQQMLAWKGMVFRRERLARAGEQTPELAALFQQLQQVAGQLAKLAWATPDPKQAARWRENVERLSAEEGTLGGGTLRPQRRLPPGQEAGHPGGLQQALPKDAVLVDFLEYQPLYAARHEGGNEEELAAAADRLCRPP